MLKFKSILFLVLMLFYSLAFPDTQLPANALKYLSTLKAEQTKYFPVHSDVSRLAAQIEQETCPSLKSSKCWNPHTELKTSREYGFGLGQVTITEKFDNFASAKKLDKSLSTWEYSDRFNAQYQIRTLVLMDLNCYRPILKLVDDTEVAEQMMYSCYNGGLGGVIADRRLCSKTSGCNPNRWFNNVANTSLKSKKTVKGYGKPFFYINREYVDNIWNIRPEKYRTYFKDTK